MNPMSRRTLLRGASAAGATAAAVLVLGRPGGAAALGTPVAAEASPTATGGGSTASAAAGAALGLVPDTPAGRVFAEWLFALNSGDVERLRAFHAAHTPSAEVERRTAFDLLFKRTWGTLQVHSVRSSAERELKALMYATLSEEWSELTLRVDPFAVQGQPAVPPSDARDRALSDEELRPALDRYLGKLAAADVFSGSVLVVRGDEPVYEAALGLANQATKVANRADTKFNLGSMNKMFTAVSVAQLVERGALAFDDPIATLLPDYPNREVAGRVTVHHLLTHTSGLGDIFGPAYFEDVNRYKEPTDYFALFADEPLKFAPGERFEYSNAGFVVLGAIVERVGGGDYYAYVREHVYGPAGMTDSDSYERDAAVPNLATGYTIPLPPDPADLTPEIVLGPREANRATLPFKGSPAGGGYSTVGDLTRFHAALWRHALLGPELTERVTTGVVDAPFGPGTKYGYGFIDDRGGGARIVGHGGGAPGVSSNLDMYPDLGLAVAVVSNYDAIASTVANRIRRMVAP